jgi:hypothetical protein
MDVVVAHTADGKLDGVLRFGVGLLSGLDYFMGDMASAKGHFGKSGQHSCRTHCLEKRTPIKTIILHWWNSCFWVCLLSGSFFFGRVTCASFLTDGFILMPNLSQYSTSTM